MKHIDADRLKTEIGELDNQFRTGNYYLDNSEQAVGYQNALTDICGIIDSLQQERKPAWKPSEEQIAILWDAISNLKHDGYKHAAELISLYEQLKKL